MQQGKTHNSQNWPQDVEEILHESILRFSTEKAQLIRDEIG
jgi:hypothetical protein